MSTCATAGDVEGRRRRPAPRRRARRRRVPRGDARRAGGRRAAPARPRPRAARSGGAAARGAARRAVVRTRAPGRAVFGPAALTGEPTLARLLGDVDVLWIPAPAPVAPGDVPYVLTVHDRSFEERPGGLHRLRARVAPRRAPAGARAAEPLAWSPTPRRWRDELRAAWGLERVAVVPPGVRRPDALGAVPGRPRACSSGALEPRKDPVLAARAASAAGRPRALRGDGAAGPAPSQAAGGGAARPGRGRRAARAAGERARARAALPPRGLRVPAARGRAARHAERRERPPGAPRDARRRRRALRARGRPDAFAAAIRRLRADPALGNAAERAGARRGRRRWEDAGAGLRAVLAEAARRERVHAARRPARLRGGARGAPALDRAPPADPAPPLVVVDSGSSDGGAALAERHGARVVRLPGQPGLRRGERRRPRARSPTEVTVLLNPDVELLDDGLRAPGRRSPRARDALVASRGS